MAEEYWYQPISMETIRGATCEELRAELADRKDAHFSIVRELTNRAKAAEAENARLRALPLKDEVGRVLEEAKERLQFGFASDRDVNAAVRIKIDALLSRLRAGEQKEWKPEIEDGRLTIRNDDISINVYADEAIIYKAGSGIAAKKLPLGEPIIEELAMLAAAPSDQGGDRG